MTIATAPPPPPVEFGAVFSRSWDVFKRNWIVALPPILAGVAMMLIVGVYIAVLIAMIGVGGLAALSASSHHSSAAPATAGLIGVAIIGGLVITVLAVVIGLWAQTGLYGMADAAWTRGTTTLGDAFEAFRSRGGAVFVAWIGLFLLAIVAVIIALPTLFLSLIAFGLFTMYVFPSAVAGANGGFDAIGESFRLIRRFFAPSIITWLVLYAIQYGISFLAYGAVFPLEFAAMPTGSETAPHLPSIPLLAFSGIFWLASIVLLLAYTGFFAIVQVGMYHTLRAQPDPDAYPRMPPQYPPQPPPPAVPQY